MSRKERIFSIINITRLALIPTAFILVSNVYCQDYNNQNENAPIEETLSSPLVDTGQTTCYDSWGVEIDCPSIEETFHGQDAQFNGRSFDFTDNGNGTVTDNVTELVWQQVPSELPYSWTKAQEFCEDLAFADSIDWRAPSLKELFSISDFKTGTPYIDEKYFVLADVSEIKQQQYWSSDYYEIETIHGGAPSAFAVNHGTGHIKAYPDGGDESVMATKYVRCVKGEDYLINNFFDNHDGSVTDNATGLMWMQQDSSIPLDWGNALLFAKQKNAEHYLGYSDWRVPNIKELQSIVDYSASYPAINSLYFSITDTASFFWTSTSAYYSPQYPRYFYAWYVDFGAALGSNGEDLHGAGAVRFDTKAEGGPAGEQPEKIYNYVRLVRDNHI